MKYFLHDTNAFNDEKITELFMKYGYEGIGLFFTALEKIALQEKPVKTIVLKKQLQVGKRLEKCWSFMESLGILSSSNGETFNEQLLKFSEKYRIKKEKNKIRIANFREEKGNVTRYSGQCNAGKVKESKVKVSKCIIENTNTPADETRNFFNDFILQEKMIDYLVSKGLDSQNALFQIQKFINYWTEKNKSGTKQKWELEKTFEIKKRLATWLSNMNQFNKNYQNKTINTIKL